MKNIFAICGSTRKESSNLQLLKIIKEMAKNMDLEVEIFNEIGTIPHFNPEIVEDPDAVKAFKQKLKLADGIMICTPEYAMGVPGTLKNAIDWTVGSMEFSHKAVAIITASSLGEKAHDSLIGIMKILEADTDESIQLLISSIKTKVNPEKITDIATEKALIKILETLKNQVEA